MEKRLDYIDLLKGLGIILMIMGHVGFGEYFDHYIHAFHMPIFFLISGWLYKEKKWSFPVFLARKVRTLLVPYLLFGIVKIGEEFVFGAFSWDNVLSFFFWNTKGMGANWFLTAMFFGEIFFYFIMKIKSIGVRTVTVTAISLFGNFASSIPSLELPLGLSASFVCVGLMYIGYSLRKIDLTKLVDRKWCSIALPICFIGVSFLVFINGYVNMRLGEYAVIPLFWLNAVLMFGILLIAALKIEKTWHLPQFIIEIGKNSIIYLGLNPVVIDVVNVLYGKTLHRGDCPAILLLVATVCILKVAEIVVFKTKLKVLLGR